MALFYIIFWKVWIILFLMQGTKLFSSQPIRPTKVSFLIKISMEEITLGVTEKFEFENWYESKFVTRLPIFQTIRILMQRHKRTVFGRNGFPLVDTFNRVFDGNLRARRYGEMFNLKGKPHQINGNFFCIIVLLGFSHKEKPQNFLWNLLVRAEGRNSLKVWNEEHFVF